VTPVGRDVYHAVIAAERCASPDLAGGIVVDFDSPSTVGLYRPSVWEVQPARAGKQLEFRHVNLKRDEVELAEAPPMRQRLLLAIPE
jgi:hypothetical protein